VVDPQIRDYGLLISGPCHSPALTSDDGRVKQTKME
jgi:hypothetical protein